MYLRLLAVVAVFNATLAQARAPSAVGLFALGMGAGWLILRANPPPKGGEHDQAPPQNPLEIARDPQMEANGYLLHVVDAEGHDRTLVANPVQFDETPPYATRGPLFAEHTDDILRELGKSEDEIIQLKIDGACT